MKVFIVAITRFYRNKPSKQGESFPCPICSGLSIATSESIVTPFGKYHMWQCKTCGSEFAIPRRSPPPDYYNYEKPEIRWEFYEVLRYLQKHGIKRGILDLGCGEGAFVGFLLHEGIEAMGIDFNEKNINKAVSLGLPCYLGDIHDLPSKQYTVITAFHVLEHVEDPAKIMEEVWKHLTDNGLFFVSIPNVERYHLHYMRDDADYPPNHLSRITHKGMLHLAQQSNFEVEWWRIEPYKTSWRMATSMTSNRVLQFFGIRKQVKSRPWLNYPVKLICYFLVQPWVLFWQLLPVKKQGYTVLYCLRKRTER